MVDRFLAFFVDNIPTPQMIAWGTIPSLIWAYGCLAVSGYLKVKRGVRTGYTRKLFHFAIFASVAVVHTLWGTRAVCLFGGATSLVVFYAIVRGSGNVLYEAMAREKDAPRRTTFIVAPYFATLIGGITVNVLFGELAVLGYLSAGIGDAVGEPVGTRFGRHGYSVLSFGGLAAKRSYEGSAAVFAGCVVALFVGVLLEPSLELDTRMMVIVPVVGLVCAVTEAVSPHGWDNLTLQLVPCLAVWLTV